MTVRVRLRMTIACPAEGVDVKRLPGLGQEIVSGRASPNRIVEWWNGGEWPSWPIESDREGTRMAIDPNAVGATTEPMLFEWTDRDTLLYALGVGAGTEDLSFTTENSHGITQQVLPTYAVICCPAFGAAGKVGSFNWAMLLHGSQGVRLHAPLPAAGKLSVVTEVADIQDKGAGKNAIIMLRARGSDPDTGTLVAETLTTLVIRGEGGFGGEPGQRPVAPEIPDREPDARVALPTREDQPLIYRLSGDRNPLHSDPWFAKELAGFPKPIMHGLCTYGFSGRALVAELGNGEAGAITSIDARFTKPVFPGETLTTSIWRTEPGKAVFRTEASGASGPDGGDARLVLEDGAVEYRT
jgi:acyl dehydratase